MPPTLSRHWRAISANRWQAAQRQQGKANAATKAITTRPTSGWAGGCGQRGVYASRVGGVPARYAPSAGQACAAAARTAVGSAPELGGPERSAKSPARLHRQHSLARPTQAQTRTHAIRVRYACVVRAFGDHRPPTAGYPSGPMRAEHVCFVEDARSSPRTARARPRACAARSIPATARGHAALRRPCCAQCVWTREGGSDGDFGSGGTQKGMQRRRASCLVSDSACEFNPCCPWRGLDPSAAARAAI